MTASVTLASIPHRPPFLFVDEILELSSERILTRKLVDPDADFFRGHYPDQPVMPGVLLCECCFQAGALLIAHRTGHDEAAKGIPVVTRIRDARFKRIVRPGDVLDIEVTLDDVLDNAYFLTGRVSVVGELDDRARRRNTDQSPERKRRVDAPRAGAWGSDQERRLARGDVAVRVTFACMQAPGEEGTA